LIEIVVVVLIISAATMLLLVNFGAFSYWREEGFIRKLNETVQFLHRQAVTDRAFYRLELDLDENRYRVDVVRPDSDIDESLAEIAEGAGNLTLELASFLNPSIGEEATLIPPPSMPSLAEPVRLPPGMTFRDVRTVRGVRTPEMGGKSFVLFSPRGYSEFAVIHLRTSGERDITILINPFTGLTELFRDYRDFEWTYNKRAGEQG
jgi:type II secretory pathway pseudopilin PulG